MGEVDTSRLHAATETAASVDELAGAPLQELSAEEVERVSGGDSGTYRPL